MSEGDLAAHEISDFWLTEALDNGFRYSILASQLLSRCRSPYQEVEVYQSSSFGRVLRLDGSFMTSEKDEFFYHENLVHVPACAHGRPANALIIGGGNGGAAEELLKHASIQSIDLVEIDQTVIDAARKYLWSVHHGVMDECGGDERLHVHVTDGLKYVGSSTEQYDLIILDLTDPGGPSQPLYTAAFYQACSQRLKPGGLLSLHVASPFAQADRVVRTLKNLTKAFAIVRPYLVTVPLSGGPWMMACASASVDPASVSARDIENCLMRQGTGSLQYYNGSTHQAVMAQPNFVRTAIGWTGARID